MTYETFISLLPKIKKMSLPGVASHQLMSPPFRQKELIRAKKEAKNPRNAAVLVLFYPKGDDVYFALIQRPAYQGVHSGQVSLPGGKVENVDNDLKDTALRETFEEIGTPQHTIEVVKTLTEIFIPPSNFIVNPYFGILKSKPLFVPQKKEVEEIIEVPVSRLLDPNAIVTETLSTSYAKNVAVPSFMLEGKIVWGATAMILSELKMILQASIL